MLVVFSSLDLPEEKNKRLMERLRGRSRDED